VRPQPIDPPAAPALPDRWVFVPLVALVVWLPLPWGSKPPAAVAWFGFVAAALVAARLMLAGEQPLPRLPRAARTTLWLYTAWLGWCALYLLPLPAGLLGVLSPSARALHDAVDALPGGAAWHTLSILPGATLDEWILSANYLGLMWLVLVTCVRNRPRQRVVLWAIVLAGTFEALYGSVMTLSGLEYGFFEKKWFGAGWATGTFVNRNHLAGYLELAAAAGIALVLADLRVQDPQTWRERLRQLIDLALSPRMRVRVMIALMVIGLVLTRSRGGNIAFFVALALCGNAYILMRQPKYFVKSLLFFASLFIVDLLIVSQNYGLEKVAQRIEQTDLRTEQRMIALRDLVPAVKEYGVIGAGPGAFGVAFSPHRSPELRGYFDHAHNDPAEVLIETGVVGLWLLGTIAAVPLIHAFLILRRRRDPMAGALAFASTMGLVALGLHGLVDFNLQIPANGATLMVLVALCLSVSSRSSKPPAPSPGPAGSTP
jgi:putative inorganic carbon (HCO3(-)) transporter